MNGQATQYNRPISVVPQWNLVCYKRLKTRTLANLPSLSSLLQLNLTVHKKHAKKVLVIS